MSLFGTFRRVKKGKEPSQHYHIQEKNRLQVEGQATTRTTTSDSVSKLNLSSSTPNLHKLNLKPLSSSSTSRQGSSNHSSINISVTDEDDNPSSTDGDSVTSAPSELGLRPSLVMKSKSGRKPSTLGRKSSFNFATGTLTRFVSMVAIGSTLKRSTTRRKYSHTLHHDVPDSSNNSSTTDMHSKSLTLCNEVVGGGKQNPLSNSWICENVDEMKDSMFIRKNDELLIQHQQELQLGKTRDLMLQGVKKFNRNCIKGMDFFIKNNLVQQAPEDVAKFLGTHENLSKVAIGDYLGTYGEFYEKVLHSFVQNHNFKGKGLVPALRIFLASFRLPGESQKIDRMMETFAHHYCAENPGIFRHEDSCYLLSFAVIMLNTSLHNPNVKDKPSLEQFISMNRDVDNGKSLDPVFLTSCYNSIRDEEFQIPREDVSDLKLTFSHADKKGWLWKQGARFSTSWAKRWFILSNHCLYYFKSQEDTVPRSIIPLENIETSEWTSNGRYFTFILTKNSQSETSFIKSCKAKSDGTIVLGSHSEYILGAESSDDRRRWIFALKQYSSFSSYYTLVQQKKRNMNALLQRRPNREKSNASSRRAAAVRKSQISMPIERPEDPDGKDGFLLPPPHYNNKGSSVTGSDFTTSQEEELTEFDDEELSLSNFDEQSFTDYEESDIRIRVDSPISSQFNNHNDDDLDNKSELSIKSSSASTYHNTNNCSDHEDEEEEKNFLTLTM